MSIGSIAVSNGSIAGSIGSIAVSIGSIAGSLAVLIVAVVGIWLFAQPVL